MHGNNIVDTNILKANWERYRPHQILSRHEMQTLIAPVCTDSIRDLSIFSDGCANTNYKIEFTSEPSLVMRIYTREASALCRERDIHHLVEGKIPTAKMLFSDESRTNIAYPFAVFSYVEGILLRDLIFAGDIEAVSSCYFEAGRQLAFLSTMSFPQGGFFENGLAVRPFSKEEAYLNLALSLLKSSTLKRDFGQELIKRLHEFIRNAEQFLPKNSFANLSHGDFDPSNIKVLKVNGSWQISGVLDWEFAFAGTYFLDIGQMLRYSHKLPLSYENAFIDGIRQEGLELLPSWKRCAKLMDLLCLLQLAQSNPKHSRPLLNSDVSKLIMHTINDWG